MTSPPDPIRCSCRRSRHPNFNTARDGTRAKLINLKAQEGYDSLSCWKLTKPLQVKGLPVVGVCAYEEDDLIKAQHPGYYWRGPGTSPGVQLMLLTSARPEAAKAWWKKVGYSESGPKIEASSDQEGVTEIRCSDYDVKG
ncbi:hypothetical protein [Microvirga arsenatis]|uniref:Uncharacterized protein n=1 Tax=Microvirga arsenatis TaxID=2692265 RepID=A0ABW9Z3R1_9HYPH|nr:hypothetical protein [Microvirga arsenatis]NBJ13678.1 hypothetical protein [Microvirga arsenatis]NBJ27172.1 hypothetical protein [Microvirga arsenatis]